MKAKDHPGVIIVRLTGRLVEEPSKEYYDLIRESYGKGVVLDLAEVPWMNTNGLGFITGSYDVLGREKSKLVLCNVSDRIEKKLSVTKISNIISSFGSLEEALESLD